MCQSKFTISEGWKAVRQHGETKKHLQAIEGLGEDEGQGTMQGLGEEESYKNMILKNK